MVPKYYYDMLTSIMDGPKVLLLYPFKCKLFIRTWSIAGLSWIGLEILAAKNSPFSGVGGGNGGQFSLLPTYLLSRLPFKFQIDMNDDCM